MLNRLRSRLLLSYVLILAVSLAVILVALLLVLRSRPLLTEETSIRLYSQLQQLDALRELQGPVPDTGPTGAQPA
jgi:uncharacterized protein involved in exopolysaccharide biosynthesis